MFIVWFSCIFLWIFLPFQLVGREISYYGVSIFILFLSSFFIGCIATKKNKSLINYTSVQIKKSLQIISFFSFISLLCLLIDFDLSNLDLIFIASEREDISISLLTGEKSNSSLAFKIAFLTYPSAYIYIALTTIYSKKINYIYLFMLGYLPIILSTVVMGGRNPLLYAILISFFSIKIRSNFSNELNVYKSSPKVITYKRSLIKFISMAFIIITSVYFINVFLSRAEILGGTSFMFDHAESNWGISFDGRSSEFLISLLGFQNFFLLFIISWYVVQGLIMDTYYF